MIISSFAWCTRRSAHRDPGGIQYTDAHNSSAVACFPTCFIATPPGSVKSGSQRAVLEIQLVSLRADVVDMLGNHSRGRAGRSATRTYNDLSSEWFQRTFGRRTAAYAWTIDALAFIVIYQLHLPGHSALAAGLVLGLLGGAMMVLPGAMLPGYISRWQLGAWGEENTARALEKLPRHEWVIRHDVKWRDRANHDHIVAGPAVFVLNTKNVDDGSVTVTGRTIRISRLGESDDSYIATSWVSQARAEAWALRCKLEGELGFPVHVYPVVVVWAKFDAGQTWIDGKVAVVRGDEIAQWIARRPVDLHDVRKRRAVMDFVGSLPSA